MYALLGCSPGNKSLLGLNINRGAEIRIRLRQPSSDLAFYPYEHVLGTMLHELAHMARGPHDAQFYAVLDELTRVRRRPGWTSLFSFFFPFFPPHTAHCAVRVEVELPLLPLDVLCDATRQNLQLWCQPVAFSNL